MRDSPLVEYLIGHQKDRAMMAALRRGLGKKEGHVVMYPYVVPYLPEKPFGKEWIYFTVAALFGYHHDPLAKNVDIGRAMSRLEQNDSLQKRFTWLLDADTQELPMRLKSIVSLLKSKNIGIDYTLLFDDLYHWDHPEKFVQLRWARHFYGSYIQDQTTKE